MKTQAIVDLLKQGKKPMVKITGPLWDDSWGDKGMLARIVSYVDQRDNDVELKFDYAENKAHNLSLQGHNWHLTGGGLGTAFEAGVMEEDDMTEEVYFSYKEYNSVSKKNDGPDGEVPVELAEENKILAEYVKSGSALSYVEWLEQQLEELVPNCMKPWGERMP